MNKTGRGLLIFAVLLCCGFQCRAQFYTSGNEPAGLRWRTYTTEDYKLVFPEGLDSLALVYARTLEIVKKPVGATAGFVPNANYKKPLPVILHPYTANANGMVAWTPRRMELLTTPQSQAPLPCPWELHLAIHESRHVAQMQYVHEKPYRPFRWFTGDLFAAAASVLYCGPAFFEGDAVVAETELTSSGRGRTADFLEYYRASFADGDYRNYWRWRYGSQRYYTPDHYTIGYILNSGIRTVYDAPDFTARYYGRIFRHKCWPWPLFNLQGTVKEVSGKRFREAFSEVCDSLSAQWKELRDARAPFMPMQPVAGGERLFTEYYGSAASDGRLYSLRKGLDRTPEAVTLLPDGRTSVARKFAYGVPRLRAAAGKIYWQETIRDPRWERISWSVVKYSDDGLKTVKTLTRRSRYYNPAPSADGESVAVAEYPVEGGSALVILGAGGSVKKRVPAPSGMQLAEPVWVGESIYVSAVTEEGTGIYELCGEGPEACFKPVLAPRSVVIKDLFCYSGKLFFSSDECGVNELFRLEPDGAYRVTNTPQGASAFVFSEGYLYYSSLTREGRGMYRTAVDSLVCEKSSFNGGKTVYAEAEKLSAGAPLKVDASQEPEIGESKPYSRLANAVRVHSWLPLYVNPDAVESLSASSITSSATLGATAFFQNELETLTGTAGYSLYRSGGERHNMGELHFAYRGLYPVIEGNLSISDEQPTRTFLNMNYKGAGSGFGFSSEPVAGIPSLNASLQVYVPLQFSSGGWSRGVVPQLRASMSNSVISHGENRLMNRVTASVRAYSVQYVPSSCIYPRLGAGLEAGLSARFGASYLLAPDAYFYAYGYLPGVMRTHGVRLSATVQTPLGEAPFCERYVSVLPRGMRSYGQLASRLAGSPLQSCFTFDYAFPFLALDGVLASPVVSLRNMEFTLHADYSYFAGGSGKASTKLGSVGADLVLRLSNFLWVPYDTRVGVSYYYNIGAPSYGVHSLGAVFSISL